VKRGVILSQDIFYGSTSMEDVHSYLDTYGHYVISRVARKLNHSVRIKPFSCFAGLSGNHTLFFTSWLRLGGYDFEVILGREELPMGQLAKSEADFNSTTRRLISIIHKRYLALDSKPDGMDLAPILLPLC
jgi:hypothetical protein